MVNLFGKSLNDLVKGIRASKRDTGLYISSCIAEIKAELNSTDPFTKATALQKMTFLQMMGYNMSWASFSTVEVMSSHRFAHKRIGYLAACQAFHQDTEVVLLTTNLLKKELRGAIGGRMNGIYEAGLAINCVSNIVTEDLARELLPELTSLTSHPQPYIRKKAIMCLFKLFVKYPQGLRLTFDQIRKSIDDKEQAVVSCAVNVITELSDKNPKNYLHLAPALFNLLTNSNNNWMLIKVVKLMGSLVSEEPRLARKLLEPLAGIVKNTKAKSLLYESVYTITLALPYCRKADGSMPPNVPDIVELCFNTLLSFVKEMDQNLKYLGLVGLSSLTVSHPKILSTTGSHRELILQCLSDADVTIRTRALELLTGMATRKNLKELIGQLMKHVQLAEGNYKTELVGKIVFMCSMEKYSLIIDFQWYLATLIRLAHVRGIEKKHGLLLKSQIMDVALRVLPVRKFAVAKMARILLDQKLRRTDAKEEFIIADVLPAAAWIVGEYSHLIWDAHSEKIDDISMTELNSLGPYHAIISSLLHPRSVLQLNGETQAVFVQSAMKVFAAVCYEQKADKNEVDECVGVLHSGLSIFVESFHKEVQERAVTFIQILKASGFSKYENIKSRSDVDDKVEETKKDDLLALTTIVDSTSRLSNLSNNVSSAAETLHYLLIPDPMKPISIKAQKKKRNASLLSVSDLDASVNRSSFSSIFENEKKYRNCHNIDAVDFITQRTLKPRESDQSEIYNASSNITPSEEFLNQQPNANFETGLQHTNGSFQNSQQPNQRLHDPFYLNTGGVSSNETNREENSNKFGMIQLNADDEMIDIELSKKEKKSKKKEVKKKKKGSKSNLNVLGELEMCALSTENGEIKQQASQESSLPVFHSDDDDNESDDGLGIFTSNNLGNRKKKDKNEEFSELAKVDLTSPLREDEVMPINTHRQVPSIKRDEMKDEKKKKKKEKKKSKKSQRKEQVSNTTETADLLDFGSLLTSSKSNQQWTPEINPAFDLLDMDKPAFDNALGVSQLKTDKAARVKKSVKRPWMKCFIKYAGASGNLNVDWKAVSIDYQVFYSKSRQSTAASICFRVDNNSESSSSLENVKITLEGDSEYEIDFGIIGSKATFESSSKIGPFVYPENEESNFLIRGKLEASGSIVPIKVILPASFYLNPVSDLTQDDVVNELSNGYWESDSTKVEVPSTPGMDAVKVLKMLSAFLRADEVKGIQKNIYMTTGTLASKTKGGSQVRVLVKIKKGQYGSPFVAKLDVKCTSKVLCGSIVSDLKRLKLF